MIICSDDHAAAQTYLLDSVLVVNVVLYFAAPLGGVVILNDVDLNRTPFFSYSCRCHLSVGAWFPCLRC